MTPLGSLTPVQPHLIISAGIPRTPDQLRHETLTPQTQPIAAIDIRFCEPQLVTLQEKPHAFNVGCTFQDAGTGATRFEAKRNLISSRQTLLDANGIPIVNYKDHTFLSKPISYVHRGTKHNGAELLQIYADYDPRENTKVQVEFHDLLTGQKYELCLVGHWRRRDAAFWLDKGRGGSRELVAKIYCPDGVSRQKYHLDIAPNMDTVLITMICTILAQKQKEDERSTNSVASVY